MKLEELLNTDVITIFLIIITFIVVLLVKTFCELFRLLAQIQTEI